MKLFLSPAACSMSCHIAFEEAKINYELKLSDWESVGKLNPQGAVPVLVLDDGRVLTQNIAILTYAAMKAPQLLPKPGSEDFAMAYQWLSWVASDLHPTFSPLFDDELPDGERKESEAEVHALLAEADKHLAGKTFLIGNQFTIADAYLFTVFNWTKRLEINTDQHKNLNAYATRIFERPAVHAAMKSEGVLEKH